MTKTKTKTNPLAEAGISETLSIDGFENARFSSAPRASVSVSTRGDVCIDIGRGVFLSRVHVSFQWVECFENDRIPGEAYALRRRSVGMGWRVDHFYCVRNDGRDLTDTMKANVRAWAQELADAAWPADKVAATIPGAIAAEAFRRTERAAEVYRKALQDVQEDAQRVTDHLVDGNPWGRSERREAGLE